MQLALPTLLLIAGLIPGIAFVNAYYAGKFTRELVALSTLGELALYFTWAIALDAVALHVLAGNLSEQSARCLIDMATGKLTDVDLSSITTLMSNAGWIGLIGRYLAVVLGALLLGSVLRRLVWAARIDTWLPLLRMKAEWFYALQGRVFGIARDIITEADVLVSHPGSEGTRLYTGIVTHFESTADGELDKLVLHAAQRHSGRGYYSTIKPIPGDYLIIEAEHILSINLRYTNPSAIGITETIGRHKKIWRSVELFGRAFWWEDP